LATFGKIVGEKALLTSPTDLAAYSFDATTNSHGMPEVVVFPTTSNQIAEVMKLANENGIPVTPRGAGTNISGGEETYICNTISCMWGVSIGLSITAIVAHWSSAQNRKT